LSAPIISQKKWHKARIFTRGTAETMTEKILIKNAKKAKFGAKHSPGYKDDTQ
jgi:hypothetical protein